jgi:hypothetical protein
MSAIIITGAMIARMSLIMDRTYDSAPLTVQRRPRDLHIRGGL